MGPKSTLAKEHFRIRGPSSAIFIGNVPAEKFAAQRAAADQAHAKVRNELIASHMPMASRLARTFAGRGEDLDDLTQVAMLALIKAVSAFDPARGVPFAQYAYPCIVGGIKKHFRDTGWSLRISRRMQELHLQTTRALPGLTQMLSRTPTVMDLAAHLQLSEQDIRDGLRGRLAYNTQSLNLPANNGEDGEIGNLIGGLDAYLESVPERHTLRGYVTSLPQREQQILRLRFDSQLCQREIAELLGISQMHVSRMLARSLELLRAMIVGEEQLAR